MRTRRFDESRFDDSDLDPMGPMANLVDIMLVFACGLIAALALARGGAESFFKQQEVVEKGQELSTLPESLAGGAGEGMKPVGKVFRDPETGKLILVGE